MREETGTPTYAINSMLIGRFNTNVFWISYAQFQTPELLELNEGFSMNSTQVFVHEAPDVAGSKCCPKTSLS